MAKFGSGRENDKTPGILGLGAGVIGIGVLAAFDHFGHSGRGSVAAASSIVLIAVGFVCWNLRGKSWFWMTMLLFALAHISATFLVHWANGDYSMYMLAPFAILDAFICISVLSYIERRRG